MRFDLGTRFWMRIIVSMVVILCSFSRRASSETIGSSHVNRVFGVSNCYHTDQHNHATHCDHKIIFLCTAEKQCYHNQINLIVLQDDDPNYDKQLNVFYRLLLRDNDIYLPRSTLLTGSTILIC